MSTLNIKKGDLITLKPEWMDEGDENITFEAAEDCENSNRLYISDRDNTMLIKPTHLIYTYMIDRIN